MPLNSFDPLALVTSKQCRGPDPSRRQPPAPSAVAAHGGGFSQLKGLIQPPCSGWGNLEKKINISFQCWDWLLLRRPARVSWGYWAGGGGSSHRGAEGRHFPHQPGNETGEESGSVGEPSSERTAHVNSRGHTHHQAQVHLARPCASWAVALLSSSGVPAWVSFVW